MPSSSATALSEAEALCLGGCHIDENQAYKKSNDIPSDSDDKEVHVFEEDGVHHENPSNEEE